jgi:hypothetical protein
MDTSQALQHLQIEFFLLHGLATEEFGLLKKGGRRTPACSRDLNGGLATVNRLMRSCLLKVFPRPFSVSKKPYCLEFHIEVDNATRLVLDHAKDLAQCRQLQAVLPSEIGLVRFRFPYMLRVVLAGGRMRRDRWNQNGWSPGQLGIGRYCSALQAAVGWKSRFDLAVAAAKDMPETFGPQRNLAQERLDALLGQGGT